MNFVESDFDYYKRTIEGMYQNFYWKRIAVSGVALLIIVGYTAFLRDNLILNGVLILLLAAVLIYLIQQQRKFPEIYQQFMKENLPEAAIRKIEEDEYCYNVLDSTEEKVRVNKKGVRNLPSSNKQYTMMVGFSKTFFDKQPLEIIYYDVLDLTYEEKFRLQRSGYSRVPRFLRRFTLTNLKASVGNMFSFIFGNIFVLYFAFRILRYVISIFRNLF